MRGFLKMIAYMAIPTSALWFISPRRAARRLERRAAWSIARPIRNALTGRHRSDVSGGGKGVHIVDTHDANLRGGGLPSPVDQSDVPIGEAMTPAAIDKVQDWARKAFKFFPADSTRVLTDIGRDAPVGKVRDDARELLNDITEKRREMER